MVKSLFLLLLTVTCYNAAQAAEYAVVPAADVECHITGTRLQLSAGFIVEVRGQVVAQSGANFDGYTSPREILAEQLNECRGSILQAQNPGENGQVRVWFRNARVTADKDTKPTLRQRLFGN